MLLHDWLNDNVIPGDKHLNWRQAEYIFTIQKRLEIKADWTPVRATNYSFSICEVLRLSLNHCKDMSPRKNYAHLPVLVSQILRHIEPDRVMLGDRIFCVEKKITSEMIKRNTY